MRFLPLTFVLALSCGAPACQPDPAPGEAQAPGGGGRGEGSGASTGGDLMDDIHLGAAAGTGGAAGDGMVDEVQGEGCAMSSTQSDLVPVYLLFLLDQSASMGDSPAIYEQRWKPATDAIKAFVSDEASAGVYASLTFFPNDANQTLGPGSSTFGITCDIEHYASPEVEAQLLPALDPFEEAIAEVEPPNEWGTPTKVAYLGVSEYADSLLRRGNKVAIVLVTDGEPTGCEGDGDLDPFASTLEAANALSTRASTYVIGIGVTRFRLDQLAEAGGTEEAYIIDPENPEATRDALLSQVRSIQERQISCDLPIPEAPEGETLDPAKVNVQLRAEDDETTVYYNESCEEGLGWRYDDRDDPRMISLCEKSCRLVQDKNDGAVDVVFGCETKVLVIR